jgi:hypothetical protein
MLPDATRIVIRCRDKENHAHYYPPSLIPVILNLILTLHALVFLCPISLALLSKKKSIAALLGTQ